MTEINFSQMVKFSWCNFHFSLIFLLTNFGFFFFGNYCALKSAILRAFEFYFNYSLIAVHSCFNELVCNLIHIHEIHLQINITKCILNFYLVYI